MQIMLLPDH